VDFKNNTSFLFSARCDGNEALTNATLLVPSAGAPELPARPNAPMQDLNKARNSPEYPAAVQVG